MTPSESHGCRVRYVPPACRTGMAELSALSQAIRADLVLPLLVETIPGPAAILNQQRQVILANDSFVKAAGKDRPEEVMGMRLGEALGCEERLKGPDGCGTSDACFLCGAANALSAVEQGAQAVVHECRITTDQLRLASHEFEAAASRVSAAMGTLHVLILRDISGEKRRRVFERTFFHDVLNAAGGLRCLAELLAECESEEGRTDEQRLLLQITNQLIEEIHFHRQLTSAESGELVCKWEEISIGDLLCPVRDLYAKHPVARERSIVLADVVDFRLTTDRVVMQRVIGNLVKNALEASPSGGEVRIGAILDGSEVVLSVHNAGTMPRDVQLQLFKRSFSTKGKIGRGIGTYSVRLFTEQFLKGAVTFRSLEDEGTTFTVRVPRAGQV